MRWLLFWTTFLMALIMTCQNSKTWLEKPDDIQEEQEGRNLTLEYQFQIFNINPSYFSVVRRESDNLGNIIFKGEIVNVTSGEMETIENSEARLQVKSTPGRFVIVITNITMEDSGTYLVHLYKNKIYKEHKITLTVYRPVFPPKHRLDCFPDGNGMHHLTFDVSHLKQPGVTKSYEMRFPVQRGQSNEIVIPGVEIIPECPITENSTPPAVPSVSQHGDTTAEVVTDTPTGRTEHTYETILHRILAGVIWIILVQLANILYPICSKLVKNYKRAAPTKDRPEDRGTNSLDGSSPSDNKCIDDIHDGNNESDVDEEEQQEESSFIPVNSMPPDRPPIDVRN